CSKGFNSTFSAIAVTLRAPTRRAIEFATSRVASAILAPNGSSWRISGDRRSKWHQNNRAQAEAYICASWGRSEAAGKRIDSCSSRAEPDDRGHERIKIADIGAVIDDSGAYRE